MMSNLQWAEVEADPAYQAAPPELKREIQSVFQSRYAPAQTGVDATVDAQPTTAPVSLNRKQEVPSANMARGFLKRGANLAGQLGSFIDTTADALEEKLPLGSLVFDDGIIPSYYNAEDTKRLEESGKYKNTIEEASKDLIKTDFGYVPNHTWEKLKDTYKDSGLLSTDTAKATAMYGLEQGLNSGMDMIMAAFAPGPYLASRTAEIGETRSQNKGKDAVETIDMVEAFPAALGSMLLERIPLEGLGKVFKGKTPDAIGQEIVKNGLQRAKQIAKRTAGGAAVVGLKEGGTEFVQEGIIEYLGEKLGTDAAMSFAEAFDRGLGGAVAGGVYGAAGGAAAGALGANPSQDGRAPVDPNTATNTEADVVLGQANIEGEDAEFADEPPEAQGLPSPEERLGLPAPESINVDSQGNAYTVEDRANNLRPGVIEGEYMPTPEETGLKKVMSLHRERQTGKLEALQQETLKREQERLAQQQLAKQIEEAQRQSGLEKVNQLSADYQDEQQRYLTLRDLEQNAEQSRRNEAMTKLQKDLEDRDFAATREEMIAQLKRGEEPSAVSSETKNPENLQKDSQISGNTAASAVTKPSKTVSSEKKVEDLIVTTKGTPFKSQKVAEKALSNRGLQGTHEVKEHEGGYALIKKGKPPELTPQAEPSNPHTSEVKETTATQMEENSSFTELGSAPSSVFDNTNQEPVNESEYQEKLSKEIKQVAESIVEDEIKKTKRKIRDLKNKKSKGELSRKQELMLSDLEKRIRTQRQRVYDAENAIIEHGGLWGELLDLFPSSAEIAEPDQQPKTPKPDNKVADKPKKKPKDTILTTSGKPFSSESRAQKALENRKITDTHEVTEYGDGYAITRKAEPKELPQPVASSVFGSSEPDVVSSNKEQTIAQRFQESLNQTAPDIFGTEVGKLANDMADAIENKNWQRLEEYIGRAKGDNENSKKAFTKITGVDLGKTKKSAVSAIHKWAGVTKEQLKERGDKRKEELKAQEEERLDYEMLRALEGQKVKYKDQVMTKREMLDKAIDDGFDRLEIGKRGAATTFTLVNDEANSIISINKYGKRYVQKRLDDLLEKQIAEDIEKDTAEYEKQPQWMKDDVNRLFGKEPDKRPKSNNKIFTDDMAEKARAILRKKLGNINSGLDPETLQAGITLAGYHIEKGARKFAEYVKAMVDDMGNSVKPYLKSWYMAAKYDPRMQSVSGLDDAAVVDQTDIDEVLSEEDDTQENTSQDLTLEERDNQIIESLQQKIDEVLSLEEFSLERIGKENEVRDLIKDSELSHKNKIKLWNLLFEKARFDEMSPSEFRVWEKRNNQARADYEKYQAKDLGDLPPLKETEYSINEYRKTLRNQWLSDSAFNIKGKKLLKLIDKELQGAIKEWSSSKTPSVSEEIAQDIIELKWLLENFDKFHKEYMDPEKKNEEYELSSYQVSERYNLYKLAKNALSEPEGSENRKRKIDRVKRDIQKSSLPKQLKDDMTGSLFGRTGDSDGVRELDNESGGSLERASSDNVSISEGVRGAEPSATGGSRENISGDGGAPGERAQRSGSLGDDQGEVPVSSRRAGGGRAGGRKSNAKPDARGDSTSESNTSKSSRRVGRPKTAKSAQELPDGLFKLSDDIGSGGPKKKFRDNLAAIKLVNILKSENRTATQKEQEVLSRYVGWGGLSQAFYKDDGSVPKGWENEAEELKSSLNSEDYASARRSTQDAHYTSPDIVKSIWSTVERLGFTGGRILEPSVGTGNFLGFMPESVRSSSQIRAVELDSITSEIAKNLYPEAKIQQTGFENYAMPDNYFDLAIGNPPFGNQQLLDKKRTNISKFSIHNYFFAKSIDGLKPGGILAMVVSSRFLDGHKNKIAREYINKKADFLGAVRLPNNAFLKNAGTQVTTDIIFFQKRSDGSINKSPNWTGIFEKSDKNGEKGFLNEYYRENPSMILGEWGMFGSMYGPNEPAVVAPKDQDTNKLLGKALLNIEAKTESTKDVVAPEEDQDSDLSVDHANIKNGSMMIDTDGKIKIKTEDGFGDSVLTEVELKNNKEKQRLTGLIKIRDVYSQLRADQLNPSASDKQISKTRRNLNKVYDKFVSEHGPINSDANKRLFKSDPTWPQIASLEYDYNKGVSKTVAKKTGQKERGPSAKKAPVFSVRTQEPYKAPDKAESAKDALAFSLSELGKIDIKYMSKIYQKSEQDIIFELGDLVYEVTPGNYHTKDQYLSGNVKRKLRLAKKLAEKRPEFQRNVEALERVIPEDVSAIDIDVKLGSHWLPESDMTDFVRLIMGTNSASAIYNPIQSTWIVEGYPTKDKEFEWGTNDTRLVTLIQAAANQRQVSVKNLDGDTDQDSTTAANQKVELIKNEFKRWVWSDENRRVRLSKIYNDTFNTNVERVYDGSHLKFPGKVGDDIIKLRKHQANAVWRIMQSGTTLLDHVVGAGKTFTMIAAAMEMKRVGRAKKPVFVVPNHLVGQWAEDFSKLYPGANVLAATKEDFAKGKRKQFFAKIASGDWDSVIVAHSSFKKISVDKEFEKQFIKNQIREIDESLTMLKSSTSKARSIKQAEKQKDRLKTRLEKLLQGGDKDDNLDFNELGIDALFLDEAHEFKNLAYMTGMNSVGGLGDPSGSQKAADLFMKVQSILESTGGKNIVFATGTPISNTMAELFTMQRYLDYQTLKDQGLLHFDAWARMFGNVVTDWELSPSGQYKLKSRFSQFVNMPELIQRYRNFADVVNREDINKALKEQGKKPLVPKIKGGKPINLVVERSQDQADYIGEPVEDENGAEIYPEGTLVYRAENLPKRPMKGDDNMLSIMSDARKAALDMRLISPNYKDHPGSKTNEAAKNIKNLYDKWSKDKGTQLVFIDLSTPKKARTKELARIESLIKKANEGDEKAKSELDKMSPDEVLSLQSTFSVYDDLKQKLIESGIKENEIAFIHDANTDKQKKELFDKVKSGDIRVLLGSTAKMGAGMNVQDRLVALHHLDAPWRPADLEQREGRIIRQGNVLYERDPEGFEIEILRYATKGTLDSRMWQTIETKARFIEQIRKGGVIDRTAEDLSSDANNAAEMKAAASGNPLILEEMSLRQEVKKLESLQNEHNRTQHKLSDDIRYGKDRIETLKNIIKKTQEDISLLNKNESKDFKMEVEGVAYDTSKDAGEAIMEALTVFKDQKPKNKEYKKKIGKYKGFDLYLYAPWYGKGFFINLEGARIYETENIKYKEAKATGLVTRISNLVKGLDEKITSYKDEIKYNERRIADAKSKLSEWDGVAELVEKRARHQEIIEELRAPSDQGRASVGSQRQKSTTKQVMSWTKSQIDGFKKAGNTVSVVQSQSDLPKEAQAHLESLSGDLYARGYYDPKTETMYLVAENISSREEALKVLEHEVVGHYRVEKLLGSEFEPFMRRVDMLRRTGVKPVKAMYQHLKDIYGDSYDSLSDVDKAAEVVAMMAEQRISENRLVKVLNDLWVKAVDAVKKMLKKLGFDRKFSEHDIAVLLVKARRNNSPESDFVAQKGRFSLRRESRPISEAHPSLDKGHYIDRIFRLPFRMIGGIDDRGVWTPPKTVTDAANKLVDYSKKAYHSKHFTWIQPMVKTAAYGMIDRFGLDENYVERERSVDLDKRAVMMKAKKILEKMSQAGINNAAEAVVFQAILNGERPPTAEWESLAREVRDAITEMGMEAVSLKLISQESFERNQAEYLHRVYLKHEAEKSPLERLIGHKLSSRRKKIKGDELKQRGMTYNLKNDTIWQGISGERPISSPTKRIKDDLGRAPKKNDVIRVASKYNADGKRTAIKYLNPRAAIPEGFTEDGLYDVIGFNANTTKLRKQYQLAKGMKVQMYSVEMADGRKRRGLSPVGQPLDPMATDEGIWEVRATGPNKSVIWRDYTKEERTRMGEILDSRYTIAKTFKLLSHDLAVGRFYRDIAQNPNWVKDELEEGDEEAPTKSSRWSPPAEGAWVEVPKSKIKDSMAKNWGDLAGKYVRSEIWRDLNEIEHIHQGNTWRWLMTQWKLNKTARNPVVHFNNVASNLFLMDMADVRMRDLVKALSSIRQKDADYEEALLHGALGSSFIEQEIGRDVIDPILDELRKQVGLEGAQPTFLDKVKSMSKVVDIMMTMVKKGDDWFVNLYQLEDQLFRMAMYHRRVELGDTPRQAAVLANEQFIDYDIHAPWVNSARRTVLPFIGYTYRAIPLLAKTIKARPWKLAKYASLFYMMNAFSYWVSDDDEEEKQRATLPDIKQGNTILGPPRMVRVPGYDHNDNPLMWDVRRLIVGGDLLDMNQGHPSFPIVPWLQVAGPIMIMGQMMVNTDAFTGKEITSPISDSSGEKWAKNTKFLWRQLSPGYPFTPYSYYQEKISTALSGGRDILGRQYSPTTAILSSFGLKIHGHDVELGKMYKTWDFQKEMNAHRNQLTQLRKDLSRNFIDKDEYEKSYDHVMRKMDRLQKKIAEFQEKTR